MVTGVDDAGHAGEVWSLTLTNGYHWSLVSWRQNTFCILSLVFEVWELLLCAFMACFWLGAMNETPSRIGNINSLQAWFFRGFRVTQIPSLTFPPARFKHQTPVALHSKTTPVVHLARAKLPRLSHLIPAPNVPAGNVLVPFAPKANSICNGTYFNGPLDALGRVDTYSRYVSNLSDPGRCGWSPLACSNGYMMLHGELMLMTND